MVRYKSRFSSARKTKQSRTNKKFANDGITMKSNAKYLDPEFLSQWDINGNKWFIKTATEFKGKLTAKATIYEESFYNFLEVKGLMVEFQKIIYIDDDLKIKKFYIADIYVPKLNLIIEVDGGYHYTKVQQEKDYNRDCELRCLGYKVLHIDNEETFNMLAVYDKILKAK